MSPPEPLIPVGKDCECGIPLVWHQGRQWCAVYGSHTHVVIADDPDLAWRRHHRDPTAPFAGLVSACMEAPDLTRRGEYKRARRAEARERMRALRERRKQLRVVG